MFKIKLNHGKIPQGWVLGDYFLDKGVFAGTEFAREQDAIEQFHRQYRTDKAELDGVIVKYAIEDTDKPVRPKIKAKARPKAKAKKKKK